MQQATKSLIELHPKKEKKIKFQYIYYNDFFHCRAKWGKKKTCLEYGARM